jgi:hypothetical protein
MKSPTISLLLVAMLSLLLSISTSADEYNNGPVNGNSDAWQVNSGFVVSDTFVNTAGPITGMSFSAWLFPGDVLASAEVSITSREFGGTTYFDGVINFTQSSCSTNSFGFNVCTEAGNFFTFLPRGTYWLNLQNASLPSGDPIYWDENSGPSLASQSSVGTIPSESFTLDGGGCGAGRVSPDCGLPSPEPDNIVLFGSGAIALFGPGVLSLLGTLRRRF